MLLLQSITNALYNREGLVAAGTGEDLSQTQA